MKYIKQFILIISLFICLIFECWIDVFFERENWWADRLDKEIGKNF